MIIGRKSYKLQWLGFDELSDQQDKRQAHGRQQPQPVENGAEYPARVTYRQKTHGD